MAAIFKVLGQLDPAPSTLSTLYVAVFPTSVSTLMVCNRNTYDVVYRVAIAVGDVEDATKQYLVYDAPVEANHSVSFTIGVTLAAGDVVRVHTRHGGVSFSLFGAQLT